MTVAASAPGAPPSRLRAESPLRRIFSRPEAGALVGALAVLAVFTVLGYGGGFLRAAGVAGMLEIAAQTGILGVAVTLLMIGGEFDLSIGAMAGFTGMFLAILMSQYGIPPILAVPLTFILALILGAINGWLCIRTRLPSFIVTLATQLILRGATIAMTRSITGLTIVNVPKQDMTDPVLQLFSANLFSIDTGRFNIELIWWLAVVAVGTWVLVRTRFGNWIFAAGGSAQASSYVGVPVDRVKIVLFMACAGSAALWACIVLALNGSANVINGTNKEFEAIITAVVGGALLTGGYGSVVGSALGAFILGATNLGIFYAGINTDWYNAVLGLLLLLAVLVNTVVLRRASGTH
ncbi:MAG TPA: ABC transporter permease [Candidatus Limnocylindrales bacterium]|nr:ABC transporter permease [Candidatus Limnocylindrales bacterium]